MKNSLHFFVIEKEIGDFYCRLYNKNHFEIHYMDWNTDVLIWTSLGGGSETQVGYHVLAHVYAVLAMLVGFIGIPLKSCTHHTLLNKHSQI